MMIKKTTVLLTGGTGMVGRSILSHKRAAEYRIVAPTRQDVDLRSYNETEALIKSVSPDIVVHAAGKVGGIKANLENPVDFLVTNLDLGRNVIGASSKLGVRRLVNLGSSCMYPRNASNPLTENNIMKGELEPTNEGYALAKIVIARLCQYVHQVNAQCQYKTLIPCNLYGPYDKFSPEHAHLIAAVINKIHRAKVAGNSTVEIWGDGTARREFMFVEDMSEILFKCLDIFDELPDVMNVGVGADHTVKEYYELVAEVLEWTGTFTFDYTKPSGMKQKRVSVERMQKWVSLPATPIRDGIQRTYRHFLEESRA